MEFALRELSKEDLPKINQWRNDKELIDLLGNNFHYIGAAVDEQWYNDYLKNRGTNVRLAIIDESNQRFIGTTQLTGIHSINRSAEFSIMIGDRQYWSKGAGLFATKAIVGHGFQALNLNRIHLTVLEYNQRAIQLYLKAGFKQEGILREAIFKNGTFQNLIAMSLLKKDLNTST